MKHPKIQKEITTKWFFPTKTVFWALPIPPPHAKTKKKIGACDIFSHVYIRRFPKMVGLPNNHGVFLLKNDHFGVWNGGTIGLQRRDRNTSLRPAEVAEALRNSEPFRSRRRKKWTKRAVVGSFFLEDHSGLKMKKGSCVFLLLDAKFVFWVGWFWYRSWFGSFRNAAFVIVDLPFCFESGNFPPRIPMNYRGYPSVGWCQT